MTVPTPTHYLTTAGRRAQVAVALDDVLAVDIGAALLLADVLDQVSAAVLRAAGLADAAAVEVLALLWRGPDPADLRDLAAAVDDLGALGHRALLAELCRAAPDAVRRAVAATR